MAGGGIGGLVTAFALARRGFAVRLLGQSPEFREVGAGIQLGPNIFRVLDKIGLKEAVLGDAHRPPAQEMRDAISGKLITRIPLGADFIARFGQPYAVAHRDIRGILVNAYLGNELITLETSRRVDGFEEHADGITVTLESGERAEGRALIGCDGMWSGIRERMVGDGYRGCPDISPIAPCSSAPKCRRTFGGRTWCSGPVRALIWYVSAAPGRTM